jgi:hypothetical protein
MVVYSRLILSQFTNTLVILDKFKILILLTLIISDVYRSITSIMMIDLSDLS